MIGRIRGTLLEKQPPLLVLDVNGVGYEVSAPMSTFYGLGQVGSEVSLFTHHVVREDAQLLFGFASRSERELFRSLIRVSGVGPKLALTILSGIEADAFVACVHHNDTAQLVKLPGVGRKTAERLLVEMRDRLDDWAATPAAVPATGAGTNAPRGTSQLVADAESALVALGYKPQEAARAINAVLDDEIDSSEELIRLALKGMVRG